MKKISLTLLLITLTTSGNCTEDSVPIFEGSSENYQVAITSLLTPVTINRIHQWQIQLQSQSPLSDELTVEISGGMPKHNHGLATAPQMTKRLSEDQFLIEGMKFHMRGLWVIQVTIHANGVTDTLSFELNL